jgi:hypothetical protein
MENSQTLGAILVCVAPCLAILVAFMAGMVVGRRGVPRLTWQRSGTGKPQTAALLKSRVSVRNAEEPEEAS